MRCEQNLDLAAPFLHAMKGIIFDGEDGVHTPIDPSSSEAISDHPVLESKPKIFLSHSRTQIEFVDHLSKALEERCHYPFYGRRSKSLPKGKRFPDLILKAVQQCQLFVVVVSEEYFMSKWPMIELNAFLKAMKSSMNQSILPLFYELSASDLMDERRRTSWFYRWKEFERNDPKGLVEADAWMYALDELRKFNGLSYDQESKQILLYENEIVSIICKLVTPDIQWEDSHVQGHAHEVVITKIKQVGVSQRTQVKVVGLYGVGGIGKTTACKKLCNELSSDFEGRVCHIELESTSYRELLQRVLIKLTRKSQEVVQQLDEGECMDVLYRNLMKQKTFLAIDHVLDNANSIKQAMVFLRTPSHQDSVVLVTARAQRTLKLLGIDGAACLEMPKLGQADATNLFLYYAANEQHFTSEEDMSFIDLCVKRCCYSKGDRGVLHYLPSALVALGRKLGYFGENPYEWAQVLSTVRNFNAFLGEDEVFHELRSSLDPQRPMETFFSQQGLVKEISESPSSMQVKAQGSMDDSEDLPYFRPSNQLEQPQLQPPGSVTARMTDASLLPAAPLSDHDHHESFSVDDNSTAVMAEPSAWLSLGREAPTLSRSILVVEGNMPSTSSGKGPSSSPEVPTTDLMISWKGKLRPYLDIAAQCLKHVQDVPSQKFNDEQCGYLVGKLIVALQSANLFLVDAEFITFEDTIRCIEIYKLFLAIALKIKSFIQGCCKVEWLQAAMTLTNTGEYVASLGFNLELCRIYFSTGWRATEILTAAQVDSIDREEVEIVKKKASVDVDVLLDKVILKLPSLQDEDKDLAIYLLQRLKRLKPASTSLSPESPFWSAFDDFGFLGRIFQLVHPTQLLGRGTSATVHKALWFGVPVARKTFYGPEHPDYVREAQILAGLCHPNIMSMFCCGMDKRKCSIVMELMDEDLHSFMQRRLDANPHSPPFSVFEAVDVILQIGEGVNYLHENGIVHRDLKSFNILVKTVLPPNLGLQYVLVKVADFGVAKIKESSTRYSNQTSNIGSHRWMAPEVINFHNNDGQTSSSLLPAGPRYPKKLDVYSFGMICFEILTGDVPFPHETSVNKIKRKVVKGERPTLPKYCPSALKALIEECWDPEPSHRPSFASMCLSLKHLKCLLMRGTSLELEPFQAFSIF